MNASEGSAILRLIEQRVEKEVAPLRKRIAELEREARRDREAKRPSILGRMLATFEAGPR